MAVPTQTTTTRGVPTRSATLNVSMSAELSESLTELSDELGITPAAAVVKAIALLKIAAQARREGKAFGIADRADVLSDEIVGIGPDQVK